jgi:hypothetical protein
LFEFVLVVVSSQVLHLQENPSSFLANRPGFEAISSLPQDAFRRLKAQVQTLTAQVQSTPAATHPSDVSMMFEQNPNSSVLNRSVLGGGGVDPNKMNQRLKEIFKEKIATFREAVYLLMGYKVLLCSVIIVRFVSHNRSFVDDCCRWSYSQKILAIQIACNAFV